MKKTVFVIGLCVILLSMPTFLAFTIPTDHSLFYSSPKISDGTFAGGVGRGHWGIGGFNIDTVNAYLTGVYASGIYTTLSGEITNSDDEKIGEISAFIIFKIIIGTTQDIQGRRTPLIVVLRGNHNDQFVGRMIVSEFRTSPHIWGYLIPNK